MNDRDQLFEAIKSDDLDSLKHILDSNPALAAAKNPQGLTPILFARYHGRTSMLPLLKEAKPALDIFEAAALGQSDQIRQLIGAFSVKPDAVSSDGFTPLQLASFFGHLDAVKTLLTLGAHANIQSQNPMKLVALHSAAAGGNALVVEALLDAGANVNARQHGGWTALHAAAGQGSSEMTRILTHHKADPQAASDDGTTPAQLAELKGHRHVFNMLKPASV
jgi:ankyrin repeat protein